MTTLTFEIPAPSRVVGTETQRSSSQSSTTAPTWTPGSSLQASRGEGALGPGRPGNTHPRPGRPRTEHQRKDETRGRRARLERSWYRERRGRRRREVNNAGGVVAVDAVHAAPHIPLDRDAIGADVITCSAYKFFGPHVGVSAIRRDLFEKMDVYG